MVSVDRLPIGPPLLTPGERMVYRVQLRGVELASMEIGVAAETNELGGKRAIVVQSHAKALGLVKLVANIDDYFTSWVDVATGRSLRWQTDEYGTNSSDKEKTDARIFERDGDTLPIDFHLNDKPPQPEPQKLSMIDVWDYNAFLIAMRGWEAPPGTTANAEVMRSRYLWHVVITVRGKEKVTTEYASLTAQRFDGHAYKIDRNGGKAAGDDARDFSIWISDDDGRVPMQVVARTDYGDVKMQLVDYQPGNGQRLRN